VYGGGMTEKKHSIKHLLSFMGSCAFVLLLIAAIPLIIAGWYVFYFGCIAFLVALVGYFVVANLYILVKKIVKRIRGRK
jgi:hypothetical protein